jgi:small subunit ribosomal protein S18
MARNNERTPRRGAKEAARRTKKKPCALCKDKVEWIDYKDVGMLRKYMSDRGKIRARRVSGNCAQHQREIALAIKTARELVLLPYTQRTTTERSGGRGRGRGGGPGGGAGPRGPRLEAPGNGAGVAPAAGDGAGRADGEAAGVSGNGDGSVAEQAEQAASENGSATGDGVGAHSAAADGGEGTDGASDSEGGS